MKLTRDAIRALETERDLGPMCQACGRGQLTLGRLVAHVRAVHPELTR